MVNKKIKEGTTVTVINRNHRTGQTNEYHAAYINGARHLFTQDQLDDARRRAIQNGEDFEDVFVKGRFPWNRHMKV